MSKMSKTLKNIASDDNQPLTSNSDSPPKKLKRNSQASSLKTKLKYAGGFLVLLLLVIGGGVGYYLVQQRGVGDVRQQASTAITMPIIGYQRTTIRAAGGFSQSPLYFLDGSPMLSEASTTLYIPLFLRNWPSADGNRQWTNITLYNPGDDAAEITMDIYYKDGSKLGTINKTIASHAGYNSYGDDDILGLPVRDYDGILGYAKINSKDISSSWTFNVNTVCPDGSSYVGNDIEAFYAFWPPSPLEWETASLNHGSGSVNVTSTNSNNACYLGLNFDQTPEEDDGIALVPTGTPPHEKIAYGEWFNPLMPMVKYSRDLPAGAYDITFQATEEMCVAQDLLPQKVAISNVYNGGFTVSWLTDGSTLGKVFYGTETDDLSNEKNDEATGSIFGVHQITLDNLSPATEYFFKICSGSNCEKERLYGLSTGKSLEDGSLQQDGNPISFTTPGELSLNRRVPLPIFGVAKVGSESPNRFLVRLVANNNDNSSSVLSFISDGSDSDQWLVELGNAKDRDYLGFFNIEGALLNITGFSSLGKMGQLDNLRVGEAQPVKTTLSLDEDIFKNE